MVSNITSLTGNGLKDWLWQRVSAVILAAYFIILMTYFIKHPQLDYGTWTALFQCNGMKLLSVLALLSFVVHAWIGLWTITTDYMKCLYVRLSVQVVMILFLISLLIWGFDIFWSV